MTEYEEMQKWDALAKGALDSFIRLYNDEKFSAEQLFMIGEMCAMVMGPLATNMALAKASSARLFDYMLVHDCKPVIVPSADGSATIVLGAILGAIPEGTPPEKIEKVRAGMATARAHRERLRQEHEATPSKEST